MQLLISWFKQTRLQDKQPSPRRPTGKLATLPSFQTLQHPRGLDVAFEPYQQTSTSSDGSSPRGTFDLPSAGGSTTSFTTYSTVNNGGAAADSRNNSPVRKPVAQQQPAYQLVAPASRQDYGVYRDMNATQHYAPTHAYIDTHHPHISHDGTASAPPTYATYQQPMLPPSQSSYASTHATGYHPYATTATLAYPPAQYAPPVIPSINTLTGKDVCLFINGVCLLISLSHPSDPVSPS